MKVLQISKFYPPVMGGIESVAWELAEGLNRAGLRCDVLCSNQGLRTQRDRAPGGYDITRVGSLGMLLSTSMAPTMVAHVRRQLHDHDVLHVHMPDPMAALALLVAQPRTRVVVHWHSDVIRQRWALKVYEPLQSWMLGRADAIIATSTPYAESSSALRPWRSKVAVIPIGISDHRSQACDLKAAESRRRYRGRRIVFALGRMTYYKGFDVLIAAARSLPDDSVVVIGGDGELLETYKSLAARQGLAGKVLFLGHVGDHELASHFHACDVFCMSSTVRAEAYGVAILEAMVMGKPVVATAIEGSGVPWVNQHGVTGLNVPACDSAALSAALRQLLDDVPLRERLGSAARQRYEQEFDAMRMTAHTMDLYRRLLAT
jgi:glycosyltransferase involved in cell wall biosynthesis